MAWNMTNILVNGKKAISNAGGGGGGDIEADKVDYDNSTTHLTATDVQSALDEMFSNFADGVDSVYDACVAKGSTPASHSLSDVVTAIGNISAGGSILLYVISTKSTSGQDATVTVSKYIDGVLQSATDYLYSDVETPVNIDNYITLDYGVTAIQSWTYKLQVASLLLHPVDYTKTWGFTLDVSEAENFNYVAPSNERTLKKKGGKK